MGRQSIPVTGASTSANAMVAASISTVDITAAAMRPSTRLTGHAGEARADRGADHHLRRRDQLPRRRGFVDAGDVDEGAREHRSG